MNSIIISIIICAFVSLISGNENECPVNEEWNECAYLCQETCATMDEVVPCDYICDSRCVCTEGLVREETNGTCIQKSLCPIKQLPDECPVNEEWDSCGSSCPQTCATIGRVVPCTMDCNPGCVCTEGLVRKETNGTCIQESSCPVK